jgi:hypothetical protein
MTQEEINRRCGVSKAVDDRQNSARQILKERKRKAEEEINEMENRLNERKLDLRAIEARLRGQMSSAVVEGILQSQHPQESVKGTKEGDNMDAEA